MVRHKQFTTSAGKNGSARYFTDHLSVSDYYEKGAGLLQGKAFDHLGMSSREVGKDVFTALERNLHPETGAKLTPRTNNTRKEWGINPKTGQRELQTVDNRRPGMDLPFIIPKTLSEVMAENPGEFADAIERICVAAKDKAMGLAESLAKTRVRRGGAQHDRSTGNLLYLSVIHRDARPVGSKVPDPYWHSHNYIFNLTWDPVEKRLKAVQLHDVLKYADTIDAYFLSEVERGCAKLGIGTERTADGRSFEVTSVKGKEIFCKRRNEILREEFRSQERIETLTRREVHKAAKLGKSLDYNKVKTEIRNRIGKSLAQRKIRVSVEEQLAKLREQMTPEIRASLGRDAVTRAPRINWRTPQEARQEVLYSAFKQYSVVHELDVVAQLLRATGGVMTFDQALEYVKGPSFIHLDDKGHVTTELVRHEEYRMLETVRAGQDKCESILKDPARKIMDPRVSAAPDQAAATKFIWSSRDLVMDVSGIAGAGKTTLLREVVPAMRQEKRSVILLAPTSPSENNLKKDFPEAMTLQRFLIDLELQRNLLPGTVIVLDEVSMVSVPQLCKLVSLVKEKQCRLVTCGDRDQHSSPERGDAIRILQDSGSVRSVELTETYRPQVAYLKETVLDLKAHRREEAFTRLDAHGDIREVEDIFELREQAVQAHLATVREGHTAILACPVHAEARETAAVVRDTLKAEGRIQEEDHAVTRLTRLEVEGPELKDPLHYQEDRVVIFHTKVAGGFKSGQKWKVLERQPDGVFTLEREGRKRTFDPGSKGKWNVYEPSEMVLSVGDQVRITEGFQERGVVFKNNDIAKIAAVDSEKITLDDGRMMQRDFLHLDQGVCITSYAAECRGAWQIAAIAPLLSFAELDAKTFYVLVSRAEYRSLFFTDCKEAFREAVLRPGERRAVWNYEGDKSDAKPKEQTRRINDHAKVINSHEVDLLACARLYAQQNQQTKERGHPERER